MKIYSTMQLHPAAEVMPPHPPEAFEQLAWSIGKYGLLHPIVTSGGKILDGRLRYAVCRELGVRPRFAELVDGPSPWDYAFAVNAPRYKTEEQRVAIYILLAEKRGRLPELERIVAKMLAAHETN